MQTATPMVCSLNNNVLPLLATLAAVVFFLFTAQCGFCHAPGDSIDRDYSHELPRLKPVAPKDVAKTFTVADGFRIEQVAAEPIVVDPVAMAFDENGRLFVVEMRGYSEQRDDRLGRVRLLIDKDNDGKFETSHVFADGLSWPTAVICSRGGVFVAAAPDLIWFKDTNGDHRADEKRTVFTGFGRSNVQGLVNTLKWGMDNRIHGATSSSGAKLLPEPGSEDATPLVLRGRDFALDPLSMKMEATSGGGQHGLSFNRWGDKFVCSNSDHIQHVRFSDRYIARNPYFAAPSPRKSIAADGPQADVFRASPVEPWRIVRTRLRVNGIVPGPVEGGGTPAGYFTGATGVTIFRGNGWPENFAGQAIVGDVGSNLIHRKAVSETAGGYIAKRIDEKSELVASTDTWFRPAQFANAPDGSLYVADMYRETIEHPKSLPLVIKKHLDLTSGRDRGRIYRIVGSDFRQPPPTKLGSFSTEQLVRTLAHPNGWHRETAARLLYEQQDLSAAKPLRNLIEKSESPDARIRGLMALHSIRSLTTEVVLSSLADQHPRVREWAVRLSEHFIEESPLIRRKVLSLTKDESFRVRCQLAFSLGQVSFSGRTQAISELALSDGNNEFMQVAVMSSVGHGAGELLGTLAVSKERSLPQVQYFVSQLAAQIGKQQAPADIAALFKLLPRLTDDFTDTRMLILRSLAAKKGGDLSIQLAAISGGESSRMISKLVEKARVSATNEALAVSKRVAAIETLMLGEFSGNEPLFLTLLSVSQPLEIQKAALTTLASYENKNVASFIVKRWTAFSPAIRNQAGDVLFSRETWTLELLAAIRLKQIPAGDLDPSRRMILKHHPNRNIHRLANELLSSASSQTQQELAKAYRVAINGRGDAVKGKAVFKKVCSACHQLEGVGYTLAPNLAAMKNRGREAILANVLAPNREVNPQYISYLLETRSGRIFTGVISSETATSITLTRGENKSNRVLRVDIESLKSTGLSLMPEELYKDLNPQAMTDLIDYIESVK